MLIIYHTKYATANANKKNKIVRIIVKRCKTASRPRAFCFPKSCSAPPLIAPDKPALLPCCNKTTAIKQIATIMSKTVNNVPTSLFPPNNGLFHFTLAKKRGTNKLFFYKNAMIGTASYPFFKLIL